MVQDRGRAAWWRILRNEFSRYPAFFRAVVGAGDRPSRSKPRCAPWPKPGLGRGQGPPRGTLLKPGPMGVDILGRYLRYSDRMEIYGPDAHRGRPGEKQMNLQKIYTALLTADCRAWGSCSGTTSRATTRRWRTYVILTTTCSPWRRRPHGLFRRQDRTGRAKSALEKPGIWDWTPLNWNWRNFVVSHSRV